MKKNQGLKLVREPKAIRRTSSELADQADRCAKILESEFLPRLLAGSLTRENMEGTIAFLHDVAEAFSPWPEGHTLPTGGA